MPSRVRSITLDSLSPTQYGPNVDYLVMKAGRRVSQLAVITLAATAAGTVGLKIGQEGDPIRLNTQGQVIQLDGEDALGGIWIVWLSPGSGLVEFGLSAD